MTSEWRACPDCRNMRGYDCDICDGEGAIRPTVATEALLATVQSGVTWTTAERMLRDLARHPDELLAWLVEWEILTPTGWSMDFAPRDHTRGPFEKGYVPPKHQPIEGKGGRIGSLYLRRRP